jgi:hypothetical protein
VTERKPPGVTWESWIERQIRESMERGEFDGLPGTGKRLRNIDQPRDDMWWIREKLRRADVSYLPPALELRKQVDDALDLIERAATEAEVRQIAGEINERIVYLNSHLTAGPPSTLMPLDVERIVRDWRAALH